MVVPGSWMLRKVEHTDDMYREVVKNTALARRWPAIVLNECNGLNF